MDWRDLKRTLLGVGGEALVVPPSGTDLQALLVREGREFAAGGARLVPGEPSQCHVNAAKLCDQGLADDLVTGYALSDDGLWRQHSWALKDGTVLETTVRGTSGWL
jgi:hypothetical protein